MEKKSIKKSVNHTHESWHFLSPLSVRDNNDKVAWEDLPGGKHDLFFWENIDQGLPLTRRCLLSSVVG